MSGNQFRQNRVQSSNNLGIDLQPNGAAGVTPNDANDFDQGPNRLQNFPELTLATDAGTIAGTLDSAPNTTFQLDFYWNLNCDPSGHGDGLVVLGLGQVTTNANGDGAFNVNLDGPIDFPGVVTATATDPDGNTSEFSACQPVTAGGTPPVITSISPPSVKAGNNPPINITIFGSGFEEGAFVDFGGFPKMPIEVTSNSVTITLDPVDTAGIATRMVTVSNPTSAPSNAIAFHITDKSTSDVDCNGFVNAQDVLLALEILAGLGEAVDTCTGDSDSDGDLDLDDVARILRVIAALLPE